MAKSHLFTHKNQGQGKIGGYLGNSTRVRNPQNDRAFSLVDVVQLFGDAKLLIDRLLLQTELFLHPLPRRENVVCQEILRNVL